MVFKCFDEVDKTAWLYFLFAGIKPDFVDFFHTFVALSTGIYTPEMKKRICMWLIFSQILKWADLWHASCFIVVGKNE